MILCGLGFSTEMQRMHTRYAVLSVICHRHCCIFRKISIHYCWLDFRALKSHDKELFQWALSRKGHGGLYNVPTKEGRINRNAHMREIETLRERDAERERP